MLQFGCKFFGRFEVLAGNEPVTGFHSDKARALLAYLVLEPQLHARRSLAALLWPDVGDKYALANLRNTLYRLRQTLETAAPDRTGQLLHVTRQAVQCNSAAASVDVLDFQTLLEGGFAQPNQVVPPADAPACPPDTVRDSDRDGNSIALPLVESGVVLQPGVATQMAAAVTLYQGELLAGFGVADAPPFEEWLLLQREMLHQRAILAFRMLAAGYEAAGDYEQAYVVAGRLLILDPYREASYRQIMRVLARLGQPDQALQQYEQMRQRFHDELDIEPSAEMMAFVKQIATGDFNMAPGAEIAARQTGAVPTSAHPVQPTQNAVAPSQPDLTQARGHDLGEIPSIGPFFGRVQEQRQIEHWLLHERCRVVAVLGIGGVGKSTLAARSVRAMAASFDLVLWRSLLNAPPLPELLLPLMQHLSGQSFAELPATLDEQLRRFLGYLRHQRVLLVLDNLETILDTNRAGEFRDGYAGYGQLIHQMATLNHKSHLLLTSRERPLGYGRLEGDSPLVRSLPLEGLDTHAGHALLAQRGLRGMDEETDQLIARYSGNPLALKLVADTVEEIFDGDIAEFLTDESLVFDDIRIVLDQQFARLSGLEQEILYRLAVEREPVPAPVLRNNLLHKPAQRDFVEALRALHRRSLTERQDRGFTLQNVITEYLTDRLIRIACHELETGEIYLLHRHPLMKALAKEYVRESQMRMILAPIGEYLLALFGRAEIGNRSAARLQSLRVPASPMPGYAAGNILNLLLHLQLDLTGFDFSQLAIWQAYLRSAILPDVNFAQANFAQIALTDTFGDIRAIACSPDGQFVAAGTAMGEISLWRTADTQPVAVLQDDAGPIWAVAFSPDSATLAGAGTDCLIRLWDVNNVQLRKTLSGHGKTIRSLAFSRDGATLASSGDDRTVRLWSMPGGAKQQTLEKGHDHGVRSVAFTHDGKRLFSASEDRRIHLWDLESGKIQQTLRGHSDWLKSIALSPNGDLLASASHDQTILLWDLRSGQIKQTLLGHSGWVESVVFSQDGKILASGGDDRTVRIWDVVSGALLHTFVGHSGWINGIDFGPDGETLFSGDDDRNLFFWDVRKRQPRHRLLGHLLSVESVTFSPDGSVLASGNGDQTVRFWHRCAEQREGAVHYRPKGHPVHVGHVTVVDFSADGKLLASGTADRTVHLIDVEGESVWRTLRGHNGWIKSVAFDPSGMLLASGGTDDVVYLWEVRNGQILRTLEGHSGWINTLAFSPQVGVLASGSGDETIALWDLDTGQVRRTLRGHDGWVTDLVFSPDGTLLYSAGADQTVRLWDVESGQLLQVLEGHQGWVWKVALTADGAVMASGGHDRTVRLWDVSMVRATSAGDGRAVGIEPDSTSTTQSIKHRHTLEGHVPWVTDIAINSHDQILASSSGDQAIRLWHIDSGTCLQVLKIPGPYAGMNITGATGISAAQRKTLKVLGAVEEDSVGNRAY